MYFFFHATQRGPLFDKDVSDTASHRRGALQFVRFAVRAYTYMLIQIHDHDRYQFKKSHCIVPKGSPGAETARPRGLCGIMFRVYWPPCSVCRWLRT